MIDLHIHTKYSDGTDSVKELLDKCEKEKLEIISITDHDTCESYEEIKRCRKLYSGEIIPGCEFRTSFDGYDIELLGYYIDPSKINNWKEKYYSKKKKRENHLYNINKIIKLLNENNIKYTPNLKDTINLDKDFIPIKVYNDIIQYEDNYKLLGKSLDTFSSFYRLQLANENSSLYMEFHKQYPNIEEIIYLINSSNGLVFLAHPYLYKIKDLDKFLDKLISKHKIDGIECYYSTFTDVETKHLLDYANKNGLYISGGSDYHGINKKHNLGSGNGNLCINKNILEWRKENE